MIVGRGMIASAVKTIDREDTIFFCSGVSNSNEEDDNAYLREQMMLEAFAGTEHRLIYFSSYFVNFEKFSIKKYYRHKSRMEEIIRESFQKYTIYRLPQVVGRSDNPNTLTNFIANKIAKYEPISLYTGAKRNLIDIDDVVKVIDYANRHNIFTNQTINLIAPINYSIEEIIDIFESVMEIKALREFSQSKEAEFEILLEEKIKEVYMKFDIRFDGSYLERLITKYYKRS